jgi:hypothetical protein
MDRIKDKIQNWSMKKNIFINNYFFERIIFYI